MEIGILSAASKNNRWNARFVEEIEKTGNTAKIIDYTKTFVGVVEEGRVLFSDERRLKPIEVDAVIPRIGKFVSKGLIVLKLLESKGVFTTTSSVSIENARNKLETQILLDQAGVPTPYCISPVGDNPKHLRAAFRKIQPDPDKKVMVKNLTGSHGKGVRPASDLSYALPIADGNTQPYMIQEMILPEDPDAPSYDKRLIVVGGVVVAAMKRTSRSKHELRANLAKGAKGEPYESTPRENELAINATIAVGGLTSGVDFFDSYRGSLVGEVNSNPGLAIEKITGVNVTGAYVDFILRNTTQLDYLTP